MLSIDQSNLPNCIFTVYGRTVTVRYPYRERLKLQKIWPYAYGWLPLRHGAQPYLSGLHPSDCFPPLDHRGWYSPYPLILHLSVAPFLRKRRCWPVNESRWCNHSCWARSLASHHTGFRALGVGNFSRLHTQKPHPAPGFPFSHHEPRLTSSCSSFLLFFFALPSLPSVASFPFLPFPCILMFIPQTSSYRLRVPLVSSQKKKKKSLSFL